MRNVWPEKYPLAIRLGVYDFTEDSQTMEESILLIRGPAFMAPIAARIRKEAAIPTAVGWLITEPQQCEAIIVEEQADIVMLAHKELDDPHFPYHAAKVLGVQGPQNLLPPQYAYWLKGR